MTTVAVISDTHGNRRAIDGIMYVLSECDYIIHLGDTSQDGNYVKQLFPQKTYVINGNCDAAPMGEDEIVLEMDGVKLFACHGHKYSVKRTRALLAKRAKEAGCTVALYGHTHAADEDEYDGVLLVNPGNMSRYSSNSYCYLVLHNGKAVPKIVYP